MAKVSDYREVPLDKLDIGAAQVRNRAPDRGVDELAESIEKQGLLQPILVAPTDDPDRFEILIGQRRFMAHRLLQKEGKLPKGTIMAAVLDERVEDVEAKAISLTENLLREGLSTADKIDACTYLYKHYGTIKLVVEETGLREEDVSAYVKYAQLIDPLKKLVDEGTVKPTVAVRAQKIASSDGGTTVDEAAAVELAKEMEGFSGAQQRKLVKTAKEEPAKTPTDLIEEAKTGAKIQQILVTVTGNVHAELQRYAKEQGTTQDDAAGSLIEVGLRDAGYLES